MKSIIKALIITVILALALAGAVLAIQKAEDKLDIIINKAQPAVKQEKEKITVIIDAGHGGIDGGATGCDGILEKNLNLYYAKTLADMLTLEGINAVMTRSDDVMLSWEGKTNKSADLRSRLEMTKNIENAILVSVHMNKFPSESVHGITVYYSNNHTDGKMIAEQMKKDFALYVPEGGNRPLKTADSAIYLLNNTEIPAVLVECGFVSNPDECARLQENSYRIKICTSMKASILEYIKSIQNREN